MKIPSKEELKEFLHENCSSCCLDDETDCWTAAIELHDYLMNYNSNEEPKDG